jgi:hypothetical protein
MSNKTQFGLKEWASVVEHIGQGKQTFVVRNAFPKKEKFILYPTFSYYTKIMNKPELLTKFFQTQYADFVKQTSEETLKRAKDEMFVKIAYWAECEPKNIIQVKGKSKWEALEPHHMWNNNHIFDYIIDNTAFLWVLRVHKYDEPIMMGRIPGGGPPVWYKHPAEIELTKSKPVLSDAEFEKVLGEIKKI